MKGNRILILTIGAFVIVVGTVVYFSAGGADETNTNTGGTEIEDSDLLPVNNEGTTRERPEDVTEEPVQNEPEDTAAPELGMPLPPTSDESTLPDEMIVEEVEDGTLSDTTGSATQVFNVDGKNFAFSITEIRVKEGDTVTINFESTGGFHDWTIDKFGAATKRVSAGEKTSVTFVADAAGTYEYYCSVGSHRALGIVGTLIVE